MGMTRRRFLTDLTALSACFPLSTSLMGNLLAGGGDASSGKLAKVVVVKDAGVLKDGQPLPDVVISMLEQGLENLLGCDAVEAVRRIFGNAKRVGIKINCLGGRPLATRKEVTYALANLIANRTEGDYRVTVWDRSERELRASGYQVVKEGQIRCLATDSKGIGYEPHVRESGNVGSKFSRLLTEHCDAVVSLAVLKDHGIAGISGSMKNFYGAIHNPNKYHPNGCDRYVADLFKSDVIMTRHRLSIVDGLVGIYSGGPGYKPQYRWDFKGLIMGTDPVAVDRICFDLIEEKRRQMGVPPLKDDGRYPQYIFTAGSNEIGCSDISKIEVIEIDRGV
jgi:uncharacterized protein (DUF362 family)